MFVTFEGIEGVGKTCQVRNLSLKLSEYRMYHDRLGARHICTREPGGTILADRIRKLVLVGDARETLNERAELLLLYAARKQHYVTKIHPTLMEGKIVICDRFSDSSFAYQCGGRGVSYKEIEELEKFIGPMASPDMTFLLDMPVDKALERVTARGGEKDRFESEKADFFERARAEYLNRAKKFPERIRVIDAERDENVIAQEIFDVYQTVKEKMLC